MLARMPLQSPVSPLHRLREGANHVEAVSAPWRSSPASVVARERLFADRRAAVAGGVVHLRRLRAAEGDVLKQRGVFSIIRKWTAVT